jgi:hypothetical protein
MSAFPTPPRRSLFSRGMSKTVREAIDIWQGVSVLAIGWIGTVAHVPLRAWSASSQALFIQLFSQRKLTHQEAACRRPFNKTPWIPRSAIQQAASTRSPCLPHCRAKILWVCGYEAGRKLCVSVHRLRVVTLRRVRWDAWELEADES